MSDEEHLYLILAVFYAVECAFWIRPGMFGFCSQLGGKHRLATLRWALLRNYNGGVLLGNLLPCGQAILCQQWLLSVAPDGIYAYVSQVLNGDGRPRFPERFVRFADIRHIEARGSTIYINGAVFAWQASAVAAHYLAERLRKLRAMPVEERAGAIDGLLAHHLDVRAITRRLQMYVAASADLRAISWVLFFVVYVVPGVFLWLQPPVRFLPFVGCYFGLVLLAVCQFFRVHQTLFADQTGERRKHLLLMFLSPADTVHTNDRLTRCLLANFHPLAVALALCRRDRFLEFAGDVWRDLEYPVLPICPVEDDGPQAVEAWFRERMKAAVKQFLTTFQIPVDDLTKPPVPDDVTAISYCPRCRDQYVIAVGECAGCGGRPLLPLARKS